MIGLHLGAHKTASTHLQNTLQAHRTMIEDGGVLYLDPGDLRGPDLRLGFVAAGGSGAMTHAGLLRQRLSGAAHCLISEENVLGMAHDPDMLRERRFYPGAADRLGRVLEAADAVQVTLHIALRDPAGFLASAYCQRLYSGTIEPFGAFLQGCEPEVMRWSELIARLTGVAGVAQCVVWRYEDWPAIATDVLSRMLPQAIAARVTPVPGVSHPGLSQRGHDWVMQAFAEGRTSPDLARKARRRFPKSAAAPGFQPFPEAQRRESEAAYLQDLARIAGMPGVTVLRSGDGDGKA